MQAREVADKAASQAEDAGKQAAQLADSAKKGAADIKAKVECAFAACGALNLSLHSSYTFGCFAVMG